MSHSLYFYKVSKIQEPLPEIINKDDGEPEYYYVNTDRAVDWEKELGQLRTIEYTTVDSFAVGEKLFGTRPDSMSYSQNYFLDADGPWAWVEMHFPDGSSKKVLRSEIDKYRYTKQDQVYFYRRDDISRIEYGNVVDSEAYEDKLLSKEELLTMAKAFMDEHPDDYEYSSDYSAPLFAIMKAYFSVDDGDLVVCCSE